MKRNVESHRKVSRNSCLFFFKQNYMNYGNATKLTCLSSAVRSISQYACKSKCERHTENISHEKETKKNRITARCKRN